MTHKMLPTVHKSYHKHQSWVLFLGLAWCISFNHFFCILVLSLLFFSSFCKLLHKKTLATHLWQARDFVIRETGFQGKKRRTHLEKKRFLSDRPHKVQSGRYKCCHLRDIVIYYCNDIFCMSETWLSDNESTTIVASAPPET